MCLCRIFDTPCKFVDSVVPGSADCIDVVVGIIFTDDPSIHVQMCHASLLVCVHGQSKGVFTGLNLDVWCLVFHDLLSYAELWVSLLGSRLPCLA